MRTIKRDPPELWKACRKVPWQHVWAGFRSTLRAHGRIDTRVVEVASPDWTSPHARQVARITRYRTVRATGKCSRETVCVITDLSPSQADPQRIAEIVQAEWGIENRIHYVRDVTFGEDASHISTGQGRRTWPH